MAEVAQNTLALTFSGFYVPHHWRERLPEGSILLTCGTEGPGYHTSAKGGSFLNPNCNHTERQRPSERNYFPLSLLQHPCIWLGRCRAAAGAEPQGGAAGAGRQD